MGSLRVLTLASQFLLIRSGTRKWLKTFVRSRDVINPYPDVPVIIPEGSQQVLGDVYTEISHRPVSGISATSKQSDVLCDIDGMLRDLDNHPTSDLSGSRGQIHDPRDRNRSLGSINHHDGKMSAGPLSALSSKHKQSEDLEELDEMIKDLHRSMLSLTGDQHSPRNVDEFGEIQRRVSLLSEEVKTQEQLWTRKHRSKYSSRLSGGSTVPNALRNPFRSIQTMITMLRHIISTNKLAIAQHDQIDQLLTNRRSVTDEVFWS